MATAGESSEFKKRNLGGVRVMDGQVSVWKLFTDFHRLFFAETVFLWSFRDAVCSWDLLPF